MHVSRNISLILSSLLLAAQAMASQAGWRQITLPGTTPNEATITVALYYPTLAPARAVPMGPFTVRAAIQSPPEATFKGLIVLSHGNSGTELGHSSLAEALAQDGYLVAALRHPGDNWQDRSLLQASSTRYFTERPQHVSRVIDALLRDPAWSERIAKDAQGPRVGAIGHSAGGYTVLALAGGQPDMSRISAHCQAHSGEDPIFCGVVQSGQPTTGTATTTPTTRAIPPLTDARVRAVVALSPLGVVFSPESLAKIRIPTAIYEAELDRYLVPRFHAQWITRNLPTAEFHRVPNAWHYAFMDTPSMPIASPDGDLGANPPGFDRQAFLQQLQRELLVFFDKAFR
jgi:predicted dienelactone hydrolase